MLIPTKFPLSRYHSGSGSAGSWRFGLSGGIGCEILAQTSYSHHLFWPVDNMAVLLGGRNSPHLLFAIAYYLGDSDKLED